MTVYVILVGEYDSELSWSSNYIDKIYDSIDKARSRADQLITEGEEVVIVWRELS